MALLSILDLKTSFHRDGLVARAVDGVSFDVEEGETLALVGESGSGKTVTALSILRLVPCPPGRMDGGRVLYRGRDLLSLPLDELRRVRGGGIGMVFQDPMTSLNPVQRVGRQIQEVVMLHRRLSRRAARRRAVELLERVGIPSPETRADCYPHQLSGGMKQRVAIAMALGGEPALLIADEPTTALDATVQAQVFDLLGRLQAESGLSILLISHDMGVVAELANRVVVFYAGRVVEMGPVEAVFDGPLHPYTEGLFESLPRRGRIGEPLSVIPGEVPDPFHFPAGCRFHPRCSIALGTCAEVDPATRDAGPARTSACLRLENGALPARPGRRAP
ncbi:MAG TPA: ABC transporter ATP-binding protein [Planctomycetota bacterium]|nr:ABC transporter ATP-binding protein [Planctomycetota bacterium]